jgi:hypothetical protein
MKEDTIDAVNTVEHAHPTTHVDLNNNVTAK